MASPLDRTKYGGDQNNHIRMQEYMRDTIRVTNPTPIDFKFKYDSRWMKVKAGETRDMERYLGYAFALPLAEQIIGDIIDKKAEEAISTIAKGNSDILYDKYIENQRVWLRLPRKDDPALQKKVYATIILGLVKRYGEDFIPDEEAVPQAKLDPNTPLYMQLFNDISNVRVEETMSVSDKSLADEVTNE